MSFEIKCRNCHILIGRKLLFIINNCQVWLISWIETRALTGYLVVKRFPPDRVSFPLAALTLLQVLFTVPLLRTTDLLSRLKLLNYHQSTFLFTLMSSLELNNSVPLIAISQFGSCIVSCQMSIYHLLNATHLYLKRNLTYLWLFYPKLHVVYAQRTNVWSLNYWCGYWTNEKAGSDIVHFHISTGGSFCKSYCTVAGCFASHVEDQLVVAIGPMQHEIAVNSRTHNVIQCMNYMERTRKQDNHKKWVVLRERHRKYPSFGWNSLHW